MTYGVVEMPLPNFTRPSHGNVIIACVVEKMTMELSYICVKC
jgi:hypothetical protein